MLYMVSVFLDTGPVHFMINEHTVICIHIKDDIVTENWAQNLSGR